jgi:hypothetical protein
MAQETKVEETLCSLQTFERNRYFYGKPMTVSDFEAEQRYLIGKQRYVNRLVHGAGVLCGLQVTLPAGFDAESPTVEVAEGAALDCCGNLIVVSRSSTVEVKGDFDPQKLNYLFIKYAECSKHPVMLAANGSSCEEVCCYNRIQETFEVVASTTAPGGGTTPPPQAAQQKTTTGGAAPDPATVCRGLTEKYYQENLKTCPGCDDPLVFLVALDAKEANIDEAETAKYRSVVFNNSMLHELLCDHVTDYKNPHRTSAEQVRALQSVNGVGNGGDKAWVKNIDLVSGDKTLGITTNTSTNKIDLALGANAVKRSHLNADVVEHLLLSSNTVSVVPNVATKSITLNTTPAESVTSVGGTKAVGTSNNFAREDHAHDLSEGVVERRHLAVDVYANLLRGGDNINVEPDAAAQTIKVSARVAPPGDELTMVSSVTGTKRVGESGRYAREDHAHDLFVNGRSPNESGELLLSAGDNVRIEKGAAENELVISAAGGSPTVIATGFFIFENVLPQETRRSSSISHGLDTGAVAVVLAESLEFAGRVTAGGLKLHPTAGVGRFGDITAFFAESPFLMAEVDYGQRTLLISLKDRRQGRVESDTAIKLAEGSDFSVAPTDATAAPRGETDLSGSTESARLIQPAESLTPEGEIIFGPDVRTYIIRWWAVPASAPNESNER